MNREKWRCGSSDTPDSASNGNNGRHPLVRLILWLVEIVTQRFVFVLGAILLAIALTFLSIAWQDLVNARQAIVDKMTERGTVKVLDTAVQILPYAGPEARLDPDRVLYHHEIRFVYYLELSHMTDAPRGYYRAGRCLEVTGATELWRVIATVPEFRTERFTVMMDTKLYELMNNTPAEAGIPFKILGAPKDATREERQYLGTNFDQFWVHYDMPMHALAMEWMAESGELELSIRYDPAAPQQFQFDTVLAETLKSSSRLQSVIFGLVLAGFGLYVLFFAVNILTDGMKKYYTIVLYCGIVAATPFLSSFLESTVERLGIPKIFQLFIREFHHSMDARALFLREMTESEQAAFTSLRVDVGHSRYKDVFSYFHVSRDGRALHSFNEAMQAISAQIARQLLYMPAADQFQFFNLLNNHMKQRMAGWDEPFLEGVKTLALDRMRSKALRSWAISALCEMCSANKDPVLADFIYQQYIDADAAVQGYWASFFREYFRAPSFAEDLGSSDTVRIRRALEIWMKRHHSLESVQFLASRLKELTTHPDPDIREMALKKWHSRTDWDSFQQHRQ